VKYIYDSLDFDELTALYNVSDVGLVTPVRDGMNLIAKEFVAAKKDGRGVLVLSEMAGAAREMNEALIVNPNDRDMVIDAIRQALEMPEQEQIDRNRSMQERLKNYTVRVWADDFMKHLIRIKEEEHEILSRKLTPRMKDRIAKEYRESERRLILLDYDGTLKDFEDHPEDAIPDKDILRLLIQLSGDDKNEVLIISGRDKDTLDTWFKHFNIGLIAEHGVWVREKGGEWELYEPQSNYWKDQVRPVLERYRNRTPGSIVEEKDYSLAWHYRKSEPGLGSARAMELMEEILHFTANLGIGVLEGNKVVDIKNIGINKGSAALKWLSRESFDFTLAAGDDRTDEDIFRVLPDTAWSIKVGLPPSHARYSISGVQEFRSLLKKLAEA
jgi:trehalose 6-phosphate synthase/phosphatase